MDSITNRRVEHTTAPAMLLTAREMSKRSGIGENTLRQWMAEGKIEFLQVGSHRLLCEQAIWDYYNRNKTTATA